LRFLSRPLDMSFFSLKLELISFSSNIFSISNQPWHQKRWKLLQRGKDGKERFCLSGWRFFSENKYIIYASPLHPDTRGGCWGAAGGQLIEVSHPIPPSESINTNFHPLPHPLTQRTHLTALAKTLYFARNSLHKLHLSPLPSLNPREIHCLIRKCTKNAFFIISLY
jgi:hypothetical protein